MLLKNKIAVFQNSSSKKRERQFDLWPVNTFNERHPVAKSN